MPDKEGIRRWIALAIVWSAITGAIAGLMAVPRIQSMVPRLAKAAVSTDLDLQDWLIQWLPPVKPIEKIVFLGIDERTLLIYEEDPETIDQSRALTLMAEPFPWSREVWALAIERLMNSGARLVVLDLLLGAPRDGDDQLRAVVEKYHDRLVLASTIEAPGSFQADDDLVHVKYAPPSETVIPAGSPAEASVGFVNFFPGFDGKIREVLFQTTSIEIGGGQAHQDSEILHALSSVSLRKAGKGDAVPEGRTPWGMRFLQDPRRAYPVKPLYEIFWPSLWERNYQNGDFFKDTIVMIGPAAAEFQDVHPTPAGTLLGPHLHLNAYTAAVRGSIFRRASNPTNAILIILGGFAAMLIVGFIRRPHRAIAALGFVGALFLFQAWLVFEKADLMTGVLGPLASIALVGMIGMAADYSRVYRERQLLRSALERRVSKEVMEEILADPTGYLNQIGGVRRQVAILFSDIRGFTQLSESREPEELVRQLNEYLDVMVEVIQTDRGMVDKFIGDAIMAIWGSIPTLDSKVSTTMAVSAAMGMKRELVRLNQNQWSAAGIPNLSMGLGIHRGEAITGNIGSEKRLELTAIGDAVNLASRLEGTTKQYGVEIVVSETVSDDLDEGWVLRPLDRIRVVGKNQAVTVFEPMAMPGDSDHAETTAFAEAFREAFDSYQQGKFTEAAKAFESIMKEHPEDRPAAILAERCRDFAANPPEADWDGGVALDSK